MAVAAQDAPRDPYWEWAVGVTVVVTLARLAAIRLSPLQLYGDEAQYWVWSQHLDFGYLTKPPLIAWLIRLSTLPGDAEPFVRLPAPLLHAAAALFLYAAARRLYGSRIALFGLLVYTAMPAVQLGAFVISTDTPLVAALSAALFAYAALQQAPSGAGWRAAAALGLALGLAFLAKYAALYAVIGILVHLAVSPAARRVWTPTSACAAIGLFALAAAPNIVWNAVNGFVAFRHLGDEAAWGQRAGGLLPAAVFVATQFGVFGPALFAVLLVGAVWLGSRRQLEPADTLLLAWILPTLAIVLVQASVAGAKANWAVAAFGPASILVAAWMLRWGRPRLLAAVIGLHALVPVVAVAGVLDPQLADEAGLSHALHGVRGNRELVGMLVERAKLEQLAGPLTAVLASDRLFFNLAAYYGRGYFGHDGPPLKAWYLGPVPESEGELVDPLTPAFSARVLVGALDGNDVPTIRAHFVRSGDMDIGDIWLGRGRRRALVMFVAEDFRPNARPAPNPSAK